MLLYLTRHGQTEDNLTGRMQGQRHGKLSELGISQAQLLHEWLRDVKFSAVYCSDLWRAVETVLPFMAADPYFPVTFLSDLREKNIGSYAGLTSAEADAHDAKCGVFTDLETEEDFYDRGWRVLRMLEQKHAQDENILIVSHCAIGQRIVGNMLGLTPAESKVRPGQPNAALSVFEYIDGIWKPLFENDGSHLQDVRTNK